MPAVKAKVILPSFNAERLEPRRQVPADKGNFLGQDLFLQVDGVGGNHHLAAGEHGGHQVSQGFTGAGAGLGQHQAAAMGRRRLLGGAAGRGLVAVKGSGHRPGHGQLPLSRLKTG